MAETRSIVNQHHLDIDNELLYVDRRKYYSGKLHNATPLFAKAVLGSTIVVANVAELDEQSISIWYHHHHKTSDMPEAILRTICNINAYTHHIESTRALIHSHNAGTKDPLFPEL